MLVKRINGQRVLRFSNLNYEAAISHLKNPSCGGVRQIVTTNDTGDSKKGLVDKHPEIRQGFDGLMDEVFGHHVIHLIRPLHGSEIKVMPPDINHENQEFKCDGLIETVHLDPMRPRTWKPAILACTTGDCPFIIFSAEFFTPEYDPIGLIGLVHSGWRGCAENIVGKAIAQVAQLGCQLSKLRIGLWGGICQKCYQVDEKVWRQLLHYQRFLKPSKIAWHWQLNLRGIVRQQLLEAGIRPAQIRSSLFCSHCQREINGQPILFSHRRNELARNGLFIGRV